MLLKLRHQSEMKNPSFFATREFRIKNKILSGVFLNWLHYLGLNWELQAKNKSVLFGRVLAVV